MAKLRTVFICKECGARFPRWQGKCSECQAWNSLNEEVEAAPADSRRAMGMTLNLSSGTEPVRLSEVKTSEDHRFSTGLDELDQVLGGGLVRGSVVLVGGAPGIGKSTLLLQAAGNIGTEKEPVLYVSGEESPRQIKLRADRLGVNTSGITIFSETSLEAAEALINKLMPRLVIIDSIQTMFRSDLEPAPGSLTQVRECAASLMRLAKATGVSVILVGHITKGGELAGPRILEHLVDTVLSFEAYGLHNVRALRAVKNRFGSTQETGFFAMESAGLMPIPDASAFFLSQRSQDITGSLIFPSLEGTRPVLVEIQALVSDSYAAEMGAPPTRRSVGVDGNRLNLLLAVLQKKAPHLGISKCDVYVNAAGGMRLNEPALDLPLLLAIAAARTNQLIPGDWAALGEVGVGGEVRAVGGLDMRLTELHKLGFKYCIVPARALKSALSFVHISKPGDRFDKIINSAREALKAKEDPIGTLELGPPLGSEWDDPERLLSESAAAVKAASAKSAEEEGKAAPAARIKEQAASKEGLNKGKEEAILLIPVENVLQAFKTLGIKRSHSEAKAKKETRRDFGF